MTDCERCGKNHYDMSRPTVPTCPFKPPTPGQAGVAGLLEALRSIAANTCCKPCQEAAMVARIALVNFGAPVGSAPPSDEGGSIAPPLLLDRDAVIEECAEISEAAEWACELTEGNRDKITMAAMITKALRSLKSPAVGGEGKS